MILSKSDIISKYTKFWKVTYTQIVFLKLLNKKDYIGLTKFHEIADTGDILLFKFNLYILFF